MLTRPIPSTGEAMPVIGLGTWPVFDVGADNASREPLREVVRRLVEAGGMKAAVHIKDLAPGEATAPHYHSRGHEVLCVLRGNLTTVFGSSDRRLTGPGESRYVGENVLHRGHNADADSVVQVLSINVTPRGSSARVEVPSIP